MTPVWRPEGGGPLLGLIALLPERIWRGLLRLAGVSADDLHDWFCPCGDG